MGFNVPFWTRLLIFAPMPLFPEPRVRRRDKDGIYSDANSKDLRVGRVHGLQPLGDRLRRPSCGRPGQPTIHLWMSRAGGWGITNTSLQNPGPNLAVTLGDNVTLYLNGTDNRNHNWFIDYNNNSAVNANETNVSSPNFRNPTELKWNFTAYRVGTFVYRSRLDTNVWGNITISASSGSNPLLPGGENTVLIVAGVLIIVAVIAFAAFFWRRMGKRETPPPPPPS